MAGRDSVLKLGDKTAALVGSFSGMTQMILTLLTEQGADVALVGKELADARRFVDALNDQREIYPHYGRATLVSTSLASERDAQEAVMRVVESFNRLDVIIDTVACERADLSNSRHFITHAMKFLLGRNKSRVIQIMHAPKLCEPAAHLPKAEEQKLQRDFMLGLARDNATKQLTANGIELGVCEEYLLRHFPQCRSIKAALEEFKKDQPQTRMVDSIEIANWVMFLASPLSQALNGQFITVDHGLYL